MPLSAALFPDSPVPCEVGNRPAPGSWRGESERATTALRLHQAGGNAAERSRLASEFKQIAGRMELDGSEHAISAESIYRHAYSPAGRRAGLPRLLAQRKPKRGRRRRNGRREPAIPNRIPIHQRPTKAHLRSQFGHWEGDLMHFRRQRDILLTLQERRSRLTLARRLLSKDADLTAKAIVAELGGLPARARRTITHDNGGEFARHEAVTDAIGLRRLLLRPAQPLAARVDRERKRPGSSRPSPQDRPHGLHRCRHRRRHLEPQRNASEVPRLSHAHRGIRSQPRCPEVQGDYGRLG